MTFKKMLTDQVVQELLTLQCNFNADLSREIFGNLGYHFFTKFIAMDRNLLNLCTVLDTINHEKLVSYLSKNITNAHVAHIEKPI